MKAALGCEVIGWPSEVLWRRDRTSRQRRPWVAQIIGRDDRFELKRQFVDGKNDYTGLNKRDTRGAMRWFTLEAGHLYEAHLYTGWCQMARQFITVDSERGDIVEVPEKDVPGWLERLFGPAPQVPKHTTIRKA